MKVIIIFQFALLATMCLGEGFGPWDGQTWDKQGKAYGIDPKVKQAIINMTVEGVKTAINYELNATGIAEFVDALEHPLTHLWRSSFGKVFVISGCIGTMVIIGFILFYAFKVIYACLKPIIQIPSKVQECCYTVAACGCIRRWRESRRIKKQLRKVDDEEEIPMVRRIYSNIKFDEFGPYLEVDGVTRVYNTNMTESASVDTKRDCVSRKETMLSGSKVYKAAMPGFQGQFDIDGRIVGQFSRIKWDGVDAILTAYHVLAFNRSARISIRKGDLCLYLDQLETKVLAASPETDLDFIIMQVPSSAFSQLGITLGKICTSVQQASVVSIHQYIDKETGVSAGVLMKHKKPWHVCYGASTSVGTSGAPLLNVKKQIIGVHLEADLKMGRNVGVIPPVFRLKESWSNEDHMSGQTIEEIDDDKFAAREYSDDYLVYVNNKTYDRSQRSWAEEMDFLDDEYEGKLGYSKYKVGEGRHGDEYEYESLWTCSSCGLLQEGGFRCKACKHTLKKVKNTVEEVLKQQQTSISNLTEKLEELPKAVQFEASKDGEIDELKKKVDTILELLKKANIGVQRKEKAKGFQAPKGDSEKPKGSQALKGDKEKTGPSRRRTRRNKNKETIVVPAVPLNSQSPVLATGGLITNGQNRHSSPRKVSSSASPNVSSILRNSFNAVKDGKPYAL